MQKKSTNTYGLCGAVSGDMTSKCLHISSPWILVHLKIGDPPPISLYFSMILGVLFLAILGPSHDWKGSLMMSLSKKSRVKKSWTSPAVWGPPMLSIKIPVLALLMVDILANVALFKNVNGFANGIIFPSPETPRNTCWRLLCNSKLFFTGGTGQAISIANLTVFPESEEILYYHSRKDQNSKCGALRCYFLDIESEGAAFWLTVTGQKLFCCWICQEGNNGPKKG